MIHVYFVLAALSTLLGVDNTLDLRRKFWGKRSVKRLARWTALLANQRGIPLEKVREELEGCFRYLRWQSLIEEVGRKPIDRGLLGQVPLHVRAEARPQPRGKGASVAYKEYAAALAAKCRNPDTILFLAKRGVEFDEEVCLDAGLLPCGTERLPEPDARNVQGTWVHVFNKAHNPEQLAQNISNIQLLDGEICVSSFSSERWFAKEGDAFLGVVLKGQVSQYFSGDAYSLVLKDGTRYAQRSGMGNHDEGFLNPFDSEVLYFLAGPKCPSWRVEMLLARGWEVRRVMPPREGKVRKALVHPPETVWERKAREAGYDL